MVVDYKKLSEFWYDNTSYSCYLKDGVLKYCIEYYQKGRVIFREWITKEQYDKSLTEESEVKKIESE